jgi:uncharacterized protein YbbC (DUF1343 family)
LQAATDKYFTFTGRNYYRWKALWIDTGNNMDAAPRFWKNKVNFLTLKPEQNIINHMAPRYIPAAPGAGIDQLLLMAAAYSGKRIALVCNNASLTTEGMPIRVALIQKGFNLVKLFSPEHGLSTAGEDGKYQHDGIDSLTRLPVISLYGDRMAPRKEDLHAIDLVLFDIPDIGCRFYTYLWTMTHVMEACAAFEVPLLILDRPNPIGGNLSDTEGPMLDEAHCASFIGRWRTPIRHSCTLGELALYFAATKISGLSLQVIPVSNWQRNQTRDIRFTPTSPAIQKQATALLYPGMGLLEGINVNEGRGTPTPFEVFGAPWIDPQLLQEVFEQNRLPGITSQPITYTPDAGLYAHQECNGLRLSVTNESLFRPVQTGIVLIHTIGKLYPTCIAERLYDTLANPTGKGHLDKLLGIPDAFNKIKNGESINVDVATEWVKMVQGHLLYA